jgi:hypothetical protein
VRLVSKLDLAVIAAALVCGTMWVEHGRRVSTDAPTPAEMAFRIAVAACPNSDSLPYTADCLTFMGSSQAPSRGARTSLAEIEKQTGPLASGSACPDNDNRPYPPACIRFLTGWFWRLD